MKLKKILMLTLAASLFTACSSDDDEVQQELLVNFNYGTITTSDIKDLKLTITDQSGNKTTTDVKDIAPYYSRLFNLPAGTYKVDVTGLLKSNDRATVTGSTTVDLKNCTSTVVNLTVETDYTTQTLTFDEQSWSQYIDTPQYFGPLLYTEGYTWTDSATKLQSTSYGSDWGYYWPDAFEAVSNYASTDTTVNKTYNQQLTVYADKAHSGTNFCVHFGYDSGYASGLSGLKFTDGVARQFESMYINNTDYFLYEITNGGAKAKPTDEVHVIVRGYKNGSKTSELTFDLLKDGKPVTSWTKVDLTKLGKVTEITFDMDGTIRNNFGFYAPSYFAYDDVTVRFDK